MGEVPLPPYIHRVPSTQDERSYQTVFAKKLGAVAAPTAGLHFDELLLQALKDRNIAMTEVTLHVGAGTFQTVKTEDISEHTMHSEKIDVSQSTCDAIIACRNRGGRVIAIGTTVVRTLESMWQKTRQIKPYSEETDIFIYPGYNFKIIDALLTNFHLPESTLLMLVSAFAGRQFVLSAYAHAVHHSYRFFSYGDAMWIA